VKLDKMVLVKGNRDEITDEVYDEVKDELKRKG
jgi:hypothetical protein